MMIAKNNNEIPDRLTELGIADNEDTRRAYTAGMKDHLIYMVETFEESREELKRQREEEIEKEELSRK